MGTFEPLAMSAYGMNRSFNALAMVIASSDLSIEIYHAQAIESHSQQHTYVLNKSELYTTNNLSGEKERRHSAALCFLMMSLRREQLQSQISGIFIKEAIGNPNVCIIIEIFCTLFPSFRQPFLRNNLKHLREAELF